MLSSFTDETTRREEEADMRGWLLLLAIRTVPWGQQSFDEIFRGDVFYDSVSHNSRNFCENNRTAISGTSICGCHIFSHSRLYQPE